MPACQPTGNSGVPRNLGQQIGPSGPARLPQGTSASTAAQPISHMQAGSFQSKLMDVDTRTYVHDSAGPMEIDNHDQQIEDTDTTKTPDLPVANQVGGGMRGAPKASSKPSFKDVMAMHGIYHADSTEYLKRVMQRRRPEETHQARLPKTTSTPKHTESRNALQRTKRSSHKWLRRGLRKRNEQIKRKIEANAKQSEKELAASITSFERELTAKYGQEFEEKLRQLEAEWHTQMQELRKRKDEAEAREREERRNIESEKTQIIATWGVIGYEKAMQDQRIRESWKLDADLTKKQNEISAREIEVARKEKLLDEDERKIERRIRELDEQESQHAKKDKEVAKREQDVIERENKSQEKYLRLSSWRRKLKAKEVALDHQQPHQSLPFPDDASGTVSKGKSKEDDSSTSEGQTAPVMLPSTPSSADLSSIDILSPSVGSSSPGKRSFAQAESANAEPQAVKHPKSNSTGRAPSQLLTPPSSASSSSPIGSDEDTVLFSTPVKRPAWQVEVRTGETGQMVPPSKRAKFLHGIRTSIPANGGHHPRSSHKRFS